MHIFTSAVTIIEIEIDIQIITAYHCISIPDYGKLNISVLQASIMKCNSMLNRECFNYWWCVIVSG